MKNSYIIIISLLQFCSGSAKLENLKKKRQNCSSIGMLSSKLSVFYDLESLRTYLRNHPKSEKVFKFNSGEILPRTKQRIIVSVATRKLIMESGYFPNNAQMLHVAQLVGQILDLPPDALFNRKSFKGSLFWSLKYLREKRPTTEKRDFTPDNLESDKLTESEKSK